MVNRLITITDSVVVQAIPLLSNQFMCGCCGTNCGNWCGAPATITGTLGNGTGWALQLNGLTMVMAKFTDPVSHCIFYRGVIGGGCGSDNTLWDIPILTGPGHGDLGKLSTIQLWFYPDGSAALGFPPFTVEIDSRTDGVSTIACGGPCFGGDATHNNSIVNPYVTGLASGTCSPVNYVTGDIAISAWYSPPTFSPCALNPGTIQVALTP